MSRKEKREVKELLRFMASHRAVTLGLRMGDLLALSEKTLSLHPVELACYILSDDETFGYFCRLNQNFFKQQFLLREWSDLFMNSYSILEMDEVEEDIELAGLDKQLVQDCLDSNNFTSLLKVVLDRTKQQG
ncbi:MAG: hypothetical protein ACOYK9_00015 [Chlamydiia bacterium]